jgi:FixJ family two-component response regulator
MSRELILVVDDNAEIRDILTHLILKPRGYSVITAENGHECMKIVRRQRPDLILLDYQMPRMSGLDVVNQLLKERIDVPVILMTGHGSEAIAVEVFRKGVKDYIKKLDDNFNEQELLQSIDRSLTEARLRRQRDELHEKLQTMSERLLIANANLKQRLDQLNALSKISRSVTAALVDTDTLMHYVISEAINLSESHEGAIYLIEQGQLVCRATKQQGEDMLSNPRQLTHDPLALQVIESGKPAYLTEQDIIAASRKNPFAPTGAMAAPLMIAGNPMGALVVKHTGTRPRIFNKNEILFLKALADYAALALDTTTRYMNGHTPPAGLPLPVSIPAPSQKVFISYSRGDWDQYVKPLIDRLTAEGLDVWIDQDLLRGGQDWLDQINEALYDCQVMVLCLSPEALESIYVRMEYRYFFHEKKPILPLICKETRLPAELRNIQHLPYSQFDLLVAQLKQLLGSESSRVRG